MPIYMSQKERKGKDMGLAASQARLLTLTARKADVELDIMTYSSRKQALSREMQQLSSDYYCKLNNKQVAFYANGKYNKINYNYLMGGTNYTSITNGEAIIKSNNNMILTDYSGKVVFSSEYAKVFSQALGLGDITSYGSSSPSDNQYAQMLANIAPGSYSASEYLSAMYQIQKSSSLAKEDGGSVNNTEESSNEINKLINFYLPIFKAAAANGWTSEYEEYWSNNDDYMSDSLISGTFQLALVDSNGNYTTEDSLNYFVTAGYISTNTSSDDREAITAWYEAEKLVLTNKETYWDTEISNSSTELEEIKTEIDSVKSLIDDAMKKFEWNT